MLENLSTKVGQTKQSFPEMRIAIDISLVLRLTESIVESLYSVMQSQAMPDGQDNSTLALRCSITL